MLNERISCKYFGIQDHHFQTCINELKIYKEMKWKGCTCIYIYLIHVLKIDVITVFFRKILTLFKKKS